MKRGGPLEKTIVANVIKTARSLGWWCCKMHGSQYSLAGLPDVLCIRDGRAVWLEAKRPGEEPTRIQLHRIGELANAGCSCAVVRSAHEARLFLESVA